MGGKMPQEIHIGKYVAHDMIVLVDIVGLTLLNGYRVRGVTGTYCNRAGIIARNVMNWDQIWDLVSGIDGIRTIDAQRIQITGIAFIVPIEIFPDAKMVVEQGKVGIGP